MGCGGTLVHHGCRDDEEEFAFVVVPPAEFIVQEWHCAPVGWRAGIGGSVGRQTRQPFPFDARAWTGRISAPSPT